MIAEASFSFYEIKKIGVQVHYIPVHLQLYYRNNFNYKQGDYPEAERFYEQEISLPIYPGLTNMEQDYVIDLINNFLKYKV